MTQKTKDMLLRALRNRREILVTYLMETIREEDWHGAMDAAADLREVDAKVGLLVGLGDDS